ncbi:hypothetical protein IQ249_01885 [Lusitaniella coriacea LEGE 07157]|uniref:Uncharacterized protein n=1 Tax=Lusitaniella coriacea LEGE 07157 TaxID=945747 RepID=A0A8J7DSR8_9CYAN|nr:hypothetical protein [Lusitaniella coriacea]MBE9114637.1 hypothetical protein [Lusitaniella coriacea LEGE 07157]
MFEYYDFCVGQCPQTQRKCHIFFCKHTLFGDTRFYLVLWQQDRKIARKLASCCLEVLSFLCVDRANPIPNPALYSPSRFEPIIEQWGYENAMNALMILNANRLIDIEPRRSQSNKQS